MLRSSIRVIIVVWLGWLLIALLLSSGPAGIREKVQAFFLETTGLALQLGQQVHAVTPGSSLTINESTASSEQQSLEAENRALRIQLAELYQQQQQAQLVLTLPEADQQLFLQQSIAAAVVGVQDEATKDHRQLLVAAGRQQGLVGRELVLTGKGVLIDRGQDWGLSPDQLVTAGKSLFGQTVEVGKWTTRVLPVTDPDFRTAVRIVRPSPLGPVLGPRGILAGTGNSCRLTDVVATEAVAVGDEVYTDTLITMTAAPVYCGRIISVSVNPQDSHWTIGVQPATPPHEIPRQLFVLTVSLNPERLSNH